MAYFAHRSVRGDWFGPARYLVVWGRYPVALPADAAFREHFRPAYADGQATIFALVR